MSERFPSTYAVLEQHGVDRRTFFKYCTSLAAIMGLEAAMVPKVVAAMENKPRMPVIWLHGLECTCCSESFIRSSHPIAQDIVLNMISLDYDDTLQAAAGEQVEEIRRKIMKDYKGQYLLAVEGNAPTTRRRRLLHGGRTELPRHPEGNRGGRQGDRGLGLLRLARLRAERPARIPPAPSRFTKMITNKPIINVPGCPPIAEVMTGVLTYILTFDQLPELDRVGRPEDVLRPAHSRQVLPAPVLRRRPVRREPGTTRAPRKGWCLYKMGCRGPTTYNSCSTVKWNDGDVVPDRLRPRRASGAARRTSGTTGRSTNARRAFPLPGIDATPDQVGKTLAVLTGAGVAAHLASLLGAPRCQEGRRQACEAGEHDRGGEVSHGNREW